MRCFVWEDGPSRASLGSAWRRACPPPASKHRLRGGAWPAPHFRPRRRPMADSISIDNVYSYILSMVL